MAFDSFLTFFGVNPKVRYLETVLRRIEDHAELKELVESSFESVPTFFIVETHK